MARTPGNFQLHPLTMYTITLDSEQSLPHHSPDAQDHELSFRHPNLTGYRALVLLLISGLGIPKATLMFKCKSRSESGAVTSVDLVFGIACATVLYWLGLYEESHPPWMRRWLFNSNTLAIRRNTEEWHHPGLTGYRIILLFLTTAFGTWKAALMYKGFNIAPNMLDWAFGVVCMIGLFWLGWYEKNHPPWLRWIFAENNRARRREQWQHPKLTGYRMLVVVVTASFGVSKAVLALQGKSVAATSVDLVLGVFWTSVLFWAGLYQDNCPKSFDWFFVDGYFRRLSAVVYRNCVLTLQIGLFVLTFCTTMYYLRNQEPNMPFGLSVLLFYIALVWSLYVVILVSSAVLILLLAVCVLGIVLYGLILGFKFIVSFARAPLRRTGMLGADI